MKYQAHIDGLRAIAVMAVIIYHADARLLPGGYLGVDIFFVISGLITWLIISDQRDGDFSLLRFYERRIRRILPALFVVIVATIPLAAALLLPSQQISYARSILATLLFSSNILFWQETGYFAAEAELKPLLHTWSLAVEEQFYLFYPLLLILLARARPQSRVAVISLAFAASLGLAALLSQMAPAANFYLFPTRAWELLAGGLLALAMFERRPLRHMGWLSIVGLILVAGSLVLFDSRTPMPSTWGLIPVGGTLLLIAFGGNGSFAGFLLAWRPVVMIGLISYSAYLWHWPILVFARLRFGDAMPPSTLAGLLVLCLALAWLTWRLVEMPTRRHGAAAVVSARRLFTVLTTTVAAVVLITLVPGLRVVGKDSAVTTNSDSDTPESIEARLLTNYGLSEDCEGEFTLVAACRTSETPEVLLWGDSFAMHLAPGIAAGVGARGMVQHTKSVCVPIVDISVVTPEYPASWADGCIAFNDQVLEWLSAQNAIKYVVISSPFGIVFNDVYQRGGAVATAPRPDIVRAKLIETAARIRAMGKTLIIVTPPPVTGENLGQCLATAALHGGIETTCDFTTEQIHALSRLVLDFLRDIETEIPVVSLEDLI